MRKATFATITTAGLAAATFVLASPASAAPTEVGTAQDTIDRFQADGFTVIVSRVGSAPLSECTVTAVRPGQTYSRTSSDVIGGPGPNIGIQTEVIGRTVYLDAAC